MAAIDTGYEGSKKVEEPQVTFSLGRYEEQYSIAGNIVCRLMRNGLAVGMLHVKSEEEYKWLKSKIDGEYDAEDKGGEG